ncbi:hypothetical protein [Pseudomonas fragariae (ex Marin et al. 2024)]|uniref:hypothetical protein n=1 Tax=Pseudomonas fragariae (ex Marin et al. 2024) TaxID=3080056 RepID=UPI003F79DE53
MYFRISASLLTEDNEGKLLLFAQRYDQDRIYVEFDDLSIAEAWINSLSRPHRERWKTILKHAIQLSAKFNIKKFYPRFLRLNVLDIRLSDWSLTKITLDDAFMLIDQATKIALENSHNDLMFIKTLLSEKDRKRIDTRMINGHLEVLGGGNGELKKILEIRGVSPHFRILSWTMFDSDATVPGEIKEPTQQLIDVCQSLDLVFHCLSKRAIENYICREIYELSHPGPLNAKAQALYSLNEVQISHLDMKGGLSAEAKNSPLYHDVPPNISDELAQGFGGRFAKKTYSCVEAHNSMHQAHIKNHALNEFGDKLNHLSCLLGRPI